MFWILVLFVWVIGAFVSYKAYISKWEDSKGYKIYYSIFWPIVLFLYAIHYLHNRDLF